MADGSIIINTRIDQSGADAGIKKLQNKLDSSTQAVERQRIAVEKLEREYQSWADTANDVKMSGGIVSPELQAGLDSAAMKLEAGRTKLEGLKITAAEANKKLAVALEPKRPQLFANATTKASASVDRFAKRLSNTLKSALVFTVLYKGLSLLREYMSNALKTNDAFMSAVASLKGNLLTAFQPLWGAILPALTEFVRLLSVAAGYIARFAAMLTGTTVQASSEAAKSLYDEANALKDTAGAAKKATKQMASFDEINQLSDNSAGSGGSASKGSSPDFSGTAQKSWLSDTLNDAPGWVTAGLILGGLALVALGAAIGSIGLVIAGLTILSVGVAAGDETGTLKNWADALGLGSVSEFITAGILLGGIALVGIGAALGNIGLVVAGLGLLAVGVLVGSKTGTLQAWADTLGLSKVASYATAALTLGGIALVALGASSLNILSVVAGLGLLITGFTVGTESKTFQKWWDALSLPQVSGWVTTALLLGGIGLTVIGLITANVFMFTGGMLLLGAGAYTGDKSGSFKRWWDVLMLPQVAGWVTTALLLGGIGLLVIGIATGNLLMLLAGLGMLGGAIAFGIQSGTFSKWIDTIKAGLKNGWNDIKSWWNTSVAPKLTLQYWKEKFSNIKEALTQKITDAVNGAIEIFNRFIGWINDALYFSWPGFSIAGKQIVSSGSFQLFTIPEIPLLAAGAVIPPNREFLAVLGDQKSGNNIETPEGLLRQIVREESAGGGNNITIRFEGSLAQLGRVLQPVIEQEEKRRGPRLVNA